MARLRITAAVAAVALVAGGAAGCNRKGKVDKSPVETQTATAPVREAVPMTVAGCLEAGEAPDTFVLTAAKSAGAQTTATYQLIGTAGADLRHHIGENAQVTGTLTAEQEVASRSPQTTEKDRAKGTSGTPAVQTQTELEVRKLQVTSVTPQGGHCGR